MAEKLELHHTPTCLPPACRLPAGRQGRQGRQEHASWLNMAEIEFSVLNRCYVGERVPTIEAMREEVQRCETERNQQGVKINWSFTVDSAREK